MREEEGGKRMRKNERGVKVDGAMERGLENQKDGRKREGGRSKSGWHYGKRMRERIQG